MNVIKRNLLASTVGLAVCFGNAIAQTSNIEQNGSAQLQSGSSQTPVDGTKNRDGNNRNANQAPLLIIKKNAGVSQVTQGWAVGTQNQAKSITLPINNDREAGTVNHYSVPTTVDLMQNPTGANVKNNQNALTQPPTIVISLPTCTGGQVLIGNSCACTGVKVWDGASCVDPVACESIKPVNTSAAQPCTTYYGSSAWSGNVTTTTSWSCPSTYAAPVSSVFNNTAGCTALQLCASIKPAETSSTQSCAVFYGSAGWSGDVTTTTSWSCSSTYATPTSSTSDNTSGCTSLAVTCTPGVVNRTEACGTGYNGGSKSYSETTTCPSGSYGVPSVSQSAYDTSACLACPVSVSSNFTPACGPNESAVVNSGVNATTYSCATGAAVASTSVVSPGTCTPNPVTCTPSSVPNTVACGVGFNGGTKTSVTTTTCPSGSYGAPSISTSSYDTSTCTACPSPISSSFTPSCGIGFVATPDSGVSTTSYSCVTGTAVATTSTTNAGVCQPITCTAGSVINSVACGPGFNGGNKTSVTTTTCPSGATGAASTSTSAFDASACTPCPASTNSTFTPSCGIGFVATPNSGVSTTSYSCATGTAIATTSTTNAGTCLAVVCSAGTVTENVPCGAGYNGGNKTRSVTTTCPGGATVVGNVSYGAYDTTSCNTCPSQVSNWFTPSCPVGQYGSPNSGINTTTYSCATGTSVPTTSITNPGACLACASSSTETQSCPVGTSGTQTRARTDNSCTGATTYTSWTGTCTPCSSSATETQSCPVGTSGTQTRTRTDNSCTGATTYTSWTGTCTPCSTNTTESQTCGAGYTGTQTRTRTDNICTGTTSYTSWTGTCTPCSSDTSESQACGAGTFGTQTRTKTVNICSGTTSYSAWSGTCTSCTATSTETQTCPAGFTGTQTRTRTDNFCTTIPTYSDWTGICTPICTTSTTTETVACQAPFTSGTQSRIVTTNSCYGPTYSDWDQSLCRNDCVNVEGVTVCEGETKERGWHWHSGVTNCKWSEATITRINGVTTIYHYSFEWGHVQGGTCVLD